MAKGRQTRGSRPLHGLRSVAVRPPTLVLVDDHDDLRDALAEMLERDGWSVRSFGDGTDALRAVQREPPDVVLTDLNMGSLSGVKLAASIRDRDALRSVSVVAMSGTCDPSEEERACFDAYLEKPVDFASLDRILRRTIRDRRARRR